MVKSKETMAKTARKPKSTRRALSMVSSLLFTDINDDCLIEIMKYLDNHNLLKVCKLGGRFKDIVLNRVIPLRIVNASEFSKTSSMLKLFEYLGRSMTRLQICVSDIQYTVPKYTRLMELLRLVTCYGEPGKLKKLVLSFEGSDGISIPPDMFSSVRPFFINVHTLHIDAGEAKNPSFNQFMNNFPTENLCVLHLHNAREIGEWLKIESIPKLRELHLHMRGRSAAQVDRNHLRLMNFIAAKPSLKIFNYVGPNSEAIFNAVAEHIPGLERLGEVKNLSVAIDDYDDVPRSHQNNRKKWKYLNEFKKLKFLSLTSYAVNFSNCGEIFRNLANQNTVEYLELIFGHTEGLHHDPVQIADLKRFSSLKSLGLVGFGKGNYEDFANKLFEHLIGLKSCKLSGAGSIKQASIINLIQHARHLRVLNIDCKVTSFSKLLYKKMLKVQTEAIQNMDESLRPSEPLVIYIDAAIANNCIAELGNKYKPSIIALIAKSS